MLPRRSRLTRRTFPANGTGKRAASPAFSLTYGPSSQGGVAAIVSKAVAKRSSDRHLLKRRMLRVLTSWHTPNRFLVAYAKKAAPTLSFKSLNEELTSLLSRTLR